MNVSKDQIKNLEPISSSSEGNNSIKVEEEICKEFQIQKEFSSSMNNKEDEVLSDLEDSDDEKEPIEIKMGYC
ncbi:hypothetical protein KI387_025744, partial [Taxus chinensis]